MLLEKIKSDLNAARKEKPVDNSKVALISTLYSEAKMIGKDDGDRETTDEEVINTVLYFVKNVKISIENLQKIGKSIEKEKREMELLSIYLPGKLTDEELDTIIQKMINALPEKNKKYMGRIMDELKEKYNGCYDGKTVSKLVIKALS